MKIKKLIVGVLTAMMLLTLTGCANADLGTDIKINKNGSTESKIRIKYDETINQFVEGGILKSIPDSDKLDIETYKNDEKFYVEEGSYKTEKLSIIDRIKLAIGTSFMKEYEFQNDYATAKIIRQGGIFKNKFFVVARLNENYYSQVESKIDEATSSYGSNALTSYIGKNIKEKIGAIPININLTIPFKIDGSNGVINGDNKTVSWNYTISELNSETVLSFAFTTVNVGTLVIISIITLIVVIISVVIYKRKRKLRG